MTVADEQPLLPAVRGNGHEPRITEKLSEVDPVDFARNRRYVHLTIRRTGEGR